MSSSIELEKDDNIEIDNEKLDNYKLSNIINVEQFNRQNLRVLFKNACTIKYNIKK